MTDGPQQLTAILRFSPDSFAASEWDARCHSGIWEGGRPEMAGEAVWGRDIGYFEYRLPLPDQIVGRMEDCVLRMEAAGLPAEIRQSVGGRSGLSEVVVSLNEVPIATWLLDGVRVNSRGALSRLNRFGSGEYGEVVEARVSAADLPMVESRARTGGYLIVRLEVKPDSANPGGLMVFGDRTGRFGLEPTVTLSWSR